MEKKALLTSALIKVLLLLTVVGDTGASETIYFSVGMPEPFPTTLAVGASGGSVAVAGIGLLVYFRKSRREVARAWERKRLW